MRIMSQDENRELPPLFRKGGKAAAEWRKYRRIRYDYLKQFNALRTTFQLTGKQIDKYLAHWTTAEIAAAELANAVTGTESAKWRQIRSTRLSWEEFAVAQDELIARLKELEYTNPNGILNDALYRRSTSNEIYYYRYGDGYDIDPVR
jgi:hypothetical protein